MKQILAALTCALSLAAAQPAIAQQSASPYHTRFAGDGPVILGEAAVSAFGLYRSQQRDGLTNAELAVLNKNDIPKFDRFSAGYFSQIAQTASDLLCYPTLVIAPGLLALNPAIRSHYGQVAALYVETPEKVAKAKEAIARLGLPKRSGKNDDERLSSLTGLGSYIWQDTSTIDDYLEEERQW